MIKVAKKKPDSALISAKIKRLIEKQSHAVAYRDEKDHCFAPEMK